MVIVETADNGARSSRLAQREQAVWMRVRTSALKITVERRLRFPQPAAKPWRREECTDDAPLESSPMPEDAADGIR